MILAVTVVKGGTDYFQRASAEGKLNFLKCQALPIISDYPDFNRDRMLFVPIVGTQNLTGLC